MQLQWSRANNQSPATSPITISSYFIWNPFWKCLSSSYLDSDGDSIAELYLYVPGVEHQLLLRSLTIMKGFTTQTGEAKASIILLVN